MDRSPGTGFTNPFRDPVMPQDNQGISPAKSSAEVSQEPSRDHSPDRRRREKKKVGFTAGDDSGERSGGRSARLSWAEPPGKSVDAPPPTSESKPVQTDRQPFQRSDIPELSQQQTNEIYEAFQDEIPLRRPRPAIRRGGSTAANLPDEELEGPDETGQRSHRQARAQEAFERGKRLEEDERSAPTSRYNSPTRAPRNKENVVPMQNLSHRQYDDESTDDEGPDMPAIKRAQSMAREEAEAHRLVRRHGRHGNHGATTPPTSGTRSGAVTPTDEQDFVDYRPHPAQYRGGILGSLLKLYSQAEEDSRPNSRSGSRHRRRSSDNSAGTTPQHSPPESGAVTPTGEGSGGHWYSRRQHKGHSTSSLAQLVGSSTGLGSPVVSGLGEQVSSRMREKGHKENRRPVLGKRQSSGTLASLSNIRAKHAREEIRITKHIAETMFRQRYLLRLCRALMTYGAPTHRLEEYMRMSARVLEIEAQFLYIPGSMIMSFDDASTHTTEVKLVKVPQGLDLGKLRDVHEVYKDVVHDVVGVEDATNRLREIMNRPNKHRRRVLIPVYGFAAACVGPYAFGARPIDLPISFLLGCILGVLQLVAAPRSDLYSNVFEVSAAIITSFFARMFGSINYGEGRLFCFSALAQSSIALILPGYIVLCAALELQSRNLVAGSIRMVYAIIYTLFIGFGMTIGAALYGAMDKNASSDSSCEDAFQGGAKLAWQYCFVIGFASCLVVINQGKWKQMPVMVLIAIAGYAVNTNSAKRFAGNLQLSSALGGFTIGGLANIYSRVGNKIENYVLDRWEDSLRPRWVSLKKRIFGPRSRKTPKRLEEGTATDGESLYESRKRRVGYSLAAAAMLPAIFVQVPSGISVGGSLVSGIKSADQISGNGTDGNTTPNGTELASGNAGFNDAAFNVTLSVVQIAIGVTVGLFLSALFVYPLGKKRSGLFSF